MELEHIGLIHALFTGLRAWHNSEDDLITCLKASFAIRKLIDECIKPNVSKEELAEMLDQLN